MLDPMVTTSLEDVQERRDVAVDVRIRIFQTVADAGLGGEVADQIEGLVLKKRHGPGPVFEVHLQETAARRRIHHAAVGDRFQIEPAVVQTTQFQIDVVIVVEVVDAEDVHALLLQAFEHMIADESGTSRQKYFRHNSILSVKKNKLLISLCPEHHRLPANGSNCPFPS